MRSVPSVANLARLTIVALLVMSARSPQGQQSGEDATTPGGDQAQDGCTSVVLVQCAQPEQRVGDAAAAAQSREVAHRKLQSRRLQQAQTQAGLNSIEISGERPSRVESDTWEDFRQSVARAAVPDCLSPEAFPPEQTGLLRPLVLLGGKVAGKCR